MCVYLSNTNEIKIGIMKKGTVRILGQEVRIGTKKHAILVQQVKIFNQNKEEYNSWHTNILASGESVGLHFLPLKDK